MKHRPRGFTLIEVLIALLVIALGVGALLATLTSSADSVARLREKSLAEWVALNRISQMRLSTTRPGVGVTTGNVDNFANGQWTWRQTVTDPGIAGILRVEVKVMHRSATGPAEPVAPSSAADAAPAEGEDKFPALATAYGFLGTSVGPPSGVDPDWSLSAGGAPGPGGGGPNPGGGTPQGAPQR
jgi:general secretion pathway protein I